MTCEEFDELLKRLAASWGYEADISSEGAWDAADTERPDETFEGYHISVADYYGGEGQGDEYWLVLCVVSDDANVQYFRRDGSYSSYDYGNVFEDTETYEAFPETRTMTFYERR